jgi:hypothetical protein
MHIQQHVQGPHLEKALGALDVDVGLLLGGERNRGAVKD